MAGPIHAIKAGAAYVEAFLDDKGLARGLRRAQARLQAFGAAATAIGRRLMLGATLAAAPLAASARAFSSMGDALAKASRRTGISVEALSELQFAAERSGTNMADLEIGIRRMQRTIAEAAAGQKTYQDALQQLGFTTEELLKLSPEEQFTMLADAIASIANPTLRAAAAMEIFGRNGTALLPMMEGGTKSIAALRAEARILGLVISTKDVAAAEQFTNIMGDLWRVIKRVAFEVGAALAPVLQDAAKWLIEAATVVRRFIERNRNLVVIAAKVVAGMFAAGAALVIVGKAASLVAAGLGILATAFSVVGSIVGAILSPLGLVLTAITALGAYILRSTGAGAKALGWLQQQFGKLAENVQAAWGGIADALAAGDLELAAKIAWTSVKSIALDVFKEIYRGLSWLQSQFYKALQGIGHGFLALAEIIRHVWERTVDALAKEFADIYLTLAPETEELRRIRETILKERNAAQERVIRLQAERETRVGAEPMRELDESDEAFDARMNTWLKNVEAIDAELASAEKTLARMNMLAGESQPGWQSAQLRKQFADREARENETHRKRMADIGAESIAGAEAIDALHEKRMRAIDDETAALRKERDALLAKAKWKALEADLQKLLDLAASESSAAARAGVAVAAQVTAAGARGTFDIAGLRGLWAGGPLDRLIVASEKTATNTANIEDETAELNRRMTFG